MVNNLQLFKFEGKEVSKYDIFHKLIISLIIRWFKYGRNSTEVQTNFKSKYLYKSQGKRIKRGK